MNRENNNENIFYKPGENWCWVYVLKSKKDGKCYIGSTNDLKNRVKLHNDGIVFSTKYRRPLVLVYYEAFLLKKDARIREQKLKNYGKATTELYKKIIYSLDSINGAGYKKL